MLGMKVSWDDGDEGQLGYCTWRSAGVMNMEVSWEAVHGTWHIEGWEENFMVFSLIIIWK